MDKKLNTPAYTRRCVDKYNKKIKEEYPEIYKERIQKVIDAQREKNKNMRENKPEQYKAYLKKSEILFLYKLYIFNSLSVINFLYKLF